MNYSAKTLTKHTFGALLLTALAASSALGGETKDGLRTYLELSIKMDKTEYALGEMLEGSVVIENTAPATLFSGFDVKLYHEDDLRYATTIYIKTIFPGETPFQFKNFGIPKLRNDKTSLGGWRLVIHQSNRPQDAVEAHFNISESTKKNRRN